MTILKMTEVTFSQTELACKMKNELIFHKRLF